MSNLEIIKLIHEEESFKQNVLENLVDSNGNITLSDALFWNGLFNGF